MKRLRLYYIQVAVLITLLVSGVIIFFPEISKTVQGNPHPQVNYVIFILIVVGAGMVLFHVRRINREGALLEAFVGALVEKGDPSAARAMLADLRASRFGSRSDIIDVLALMAQASEWPADEARNSILENEVTRYQARLSRRLLLTQYLGGMLVGMGLLGTFIGLLGALAEIGKLIGSFSLMTGGDVNPATALGGLVARLTEPMKAMAVAFSASLFGVLGSLVMGLFMVVIKNATGDLVSILQSRISSVLDFQPAEPTDTGSLNEALSGLAAQSPLLQGLASAMDQSERRVREMLSATTQLIARIESNSQGQERIESVIERMAQAQAASQRAQDEFLTKLDRIASIQDGLGRHSERMAETFTEHQQLLQRLRTEQAEQMTQMLERQTDLIGQQESVWRAHSEDISRQGTQQLEHWKQIVTSTESTLSLFRRMSEEQMTKDRQSWQEQFGKQQEILALFRKSTMDQVNEDRASWQEQFAKQQETLGLFRRSVADQSAQDRAAWQEQFSQHQAALGLARKQIVELQQHDRDAWAQALAKQAEEFTGVLRGVFDQAGTERNAWTAQAKELAAAVEGFRQASQTTFQSLEKRFDQQIQRWEEAGSVVKEGQKKLADALGEFGGLVNETVGAIRADSRSRTEYAVQFDRYIREYQDRQEQLMQTMNTTVAKALADNAAASR